MLSRLLTLLFGDGDEPGYLKAEEEKKELDAATMPGEDWDIKYAEEY